MDREKRHGKSGACSALVSSGKLQGLAASGSANSLYKEPFASSPPIGFFTDLPLSPSTGEPVNGVWVRKFLCSEQMAGLVSAINERHQKRLRAAKNAGDRELAERLAIAVEFDPALLGDIRCGELACQWPAGCHHYIYWPVEAGGKAKFSYANTPELLEIESGTYDLRTGIFSVGAYSHVPGAGPDDLTLSERRCFSADTSWKEEYRSNGRIHVHFENGCHKVYYPDGRIKTLATGRRTQIPLPELSFVTKP